MRQVIYDGKYEVSRDTSHKYSILDTESGSTLYPVNVTAATGMVAKPFLVPWATKLGVDVGIASVKSGIYGTAGGSSSIDEIYKRAQLHRKLVVKVSTDRGSMLHAVLESHIEGQMNGVEITGDPKDNVVQGVLGNFITWYKQFKKVDWEATERCLFHEELGYIGTTDVLMQVDGESYILDFKTGSRVYPDHALQLSAYAEADFQENGYRRERLIIHFDGKKSEKMTVFHEKDLEKLTGGEHLDDYRAFKSALGLYRWKMKGKSRWELSKKW